jgi:serine protease inhibitor
MLSTSPGEPPKIETFIADSPFIYTITESGSGLILFIGVFTGEA